MVMSLCLVFSSGKMVEILMMMMMMKAVLSQAAH